MDLEIDDFMNYCEYRNLSKKTLLSYEQTLRLFSRYLIDTYKINRSEQVTQQIILNYINDTKERGKYTVVANENTKKTNNPQNRGDYGKKVSIVTLNNYIRNLKVYFNYMYENRIIKKNPTQKIKLIHVPRKAKGYMNDIEVNNDRKRQTGEQQAFDLRERRRPLRSDQPVYDLSIIEKYHRKRKNGHKFCRKNYFFTSR